MKKRNRNALLIVGFLLLLFSVASFGGAFTVVNKLAIPNIGTIKCLQIEPQKSIDYKPIGSDVIVNCGENTPYCDFLFESDSFFLSGHIFICDKFDNCQEKLTGVITRNRLYDIGRVQQFGYIKLTDMSDAPFGLGTPESGDYIITKRFNPYGLQSFTTTGGFFQNIDKTSCKVPASNLDQYPASSPATLSFDQSTSFLNYWDTIDEEINGDLLVTYNNQESFCLGNKIYSIGIFDAKDGTTYKYPNSVKASVQCCPGAISSGAICQDDFTWKIDKGEEDECFSVIQCRGQGDWTINFESIERNVIDRFECSDGQCIIAESKTVECTDYTQCEQGEVCDNFECKTSTSGDYTNKESVIPLWMKILFAVMGIILLGLSGIVGFLFVKRRRK